jgi:polyprenyl-phospho-N-acetylgalactosaminyl synthase
LSIALDPATNGQVADVAPLRRYPYPVTLHLEESDAVAAPVPASGNNDVWVIVRCYNEASVVGDVIRGLKTVFPNVVGVDDGSRDSSSEEMAGAGANVVRHAVNLGAGAALQTGLQYALLDHSAGYFLCFDADGQHRVDDASAMIDRMRVEAMDILIGSRFLGRAENMPASRKVLLKAGRVFEKLTSRVDLTDAHNGLRVFSRTFASQVDLSMSDMAYASELLGIIARSGLTYAEHPVTIDYTEYSMHKGQRSINSVNIAMDIWMNQILRGRRR